MGKLSEGTSISGPCLCERCPRHWNFAALLYRRGYLRLVSAARMGFWGLAYTREAA